MYISKENFKNIKVKKELFRRLYKYERAKNNVFLHIIGELKYYIKHKEENKDLDEIMKQLEEEKYYIENAIWDEVSGIEELVQLFIKVFPEYKNKEDEIYDIFYEERKEINKLLYKLTDKDLIYSLENSDAKYMQLKYFYLEIMYLLSKGIFDIRIPIRKRKNIYKKEFMALRDIVELHLEKIV